MLFQLLMNRSRIGNIQLTPIHGNGFNPRRLLKQFRQCMADLACSPEDQDFC